MWIAPVPDIHHLHLSPTLMTGLVCYLGGFATLTAWEQFVVPQLKLKSILPDVPLLPNQLTEAQKHTPWITPLTCDAMVPPPTLETLRGRGKHWVGVVLNANQFITTKSTSEVHTEEPHCLCATSEEWSEYYDCDVTIYKTPVA